MKKKLIVCFLIAAITLTISACNKSGSDLGGSDDSGNNSAVIQKVNVGLNVVDAGARADTSVIKETLKNVGASVVWLEISAQQSDEIITASGVVIASGRTGDDTDSDENGDPISFIATCYNVVQSAKKIIVTDHIGNEYSAKPIGADDQTNICILSIPATLESVVMIENDESIAAGEEVLAFGNPFGTLGGSVTKGIISAVNRNLYVNKNYMDVYQTDATFDSGNSGGALFTTDGYFLGMCDDMIGKNYSVETNKITFVTPSKTVKDISQKLMETYTGDSLGYIEGRYYLGCEVKNRYTGAWQSSSYVVIYKLDEKGSFYLGGLREGDQIISVEYKGEEITVTDAITFSEYLKSLPLAVGDRLIFNVKRDERSMTYNIEIKQYVCGAK